ncbi:MAG: NAD-dependent epimerase/dehydratase family protein [Planctomycetes bacterium]|nr:NAD-dependent epimerase/dehydratase family protein [Planctomycetota bacterium]
MPPSCFLTGAAGFVGRHLVPKLATGYRLRLLLRPGQQTTHLRGIDHERIDGRLEDREALAAGVRGADLVVHLAALVSFRPEDRAAMFSVNAEGTAALAGLARAAGVRRLLHVSTISAVACRDRPEAVDETAPYNFGPLRIGYCDSKHAAERAVLAEVARGLDAVIVNPPSMYGAGDRRKGDDSLLAAVLRGRIRFCPPGGLNVANVADVCDGMLAAIARGRSGERYLLGGENLGGAQLLQRVAAIAGARAPRRTPPAALVRAAAGLVRGVEALFGSRPPLTSEILKLAARFLWYRSDKAERELGWRAGPVDAGIAAALRELRGTGGRAADFGDSV